jgi:outer membrane protein, heavy metal efflux system
MMWWLAIAVAVQPLTIDEVLRSTDQHHPLIAVSLAEQAMARGELLSQEGGFDPSIRARANAGAGYYPNINGDVGVDVPLPWWGASTSGGWRINAGDVPVYDGKKKTNDYGELRAGLLVPLLRDGYIDRRRAGIQRAELEKDVQQQAVRAARLELLRQASLLFWEWVAAGERLHVAEHLLLLADTRRTQLAKRAATGDVPALDLVDNDRLVAQRQARLALAVRSLEKAALDLSLYLRDSQGAPMVAVAAQLPSLAVSSDGCVATELTARALQQRPDVARARLVIDQVAVDVSLAENQLWPSLSLSGQAALDVGPTTPSSSSSSSVWNPDPKTRSSPEFDVGLSFELPVPMRQARGRLGIVEEQRVRANQQWRLLQDRVGVEIADACSAARAAGARVVAVGQEVVAAQAIEDGERARYDAGDSTLLWVNLREQATAEAELSAIDATIDSQRAAIMRDAATADLLARIAR